MNSVWNSDVEQCRKDPAAIRLQPEPAADRRPIAKEFLDQLIFIRIELYGNTI
jgi:hypothetical protein